MWDGWAVWVALGVALLAALVILDLLARRAVVGFAMPFFEREPPFNLIPEPPEPGAHTVRVPIEGATNARGGTLSLAVSVVPAAGELRGAVIFCPETGGSRWFWRRYAAALPEKGFAVISFEHRGMFDSDTDPDHTPGHWPTESEVADALAVTRTVLDDPEEFDLPADAPIGLFGVSRGACVALAAAAREPRVAAVAADGGFVTDGVLTEFARRWAMLAVPKWFVPLIPTWHIRQSMWFLRKAADRKQSVRFLALQRDLRRLRSRPVWLVSGVRDSYVTPEQTRGLARAVGGEAWLVPKAKHNQARELATAEYDARLTSFFADAFDDDA